MLLGPIKTAARRVVTQQTRGMKVAVLGASGGTVLFPAIEECYYALKNVQTRYKHVLVVTDAGVETGPYESLLRKMSDEGIAVSTVLVGPGRHSEFLIHSAAVTATQSPALRHPERVCAPQCHPCQ